MKTNTKKIVAGSVTAVWCLFVAWAGGIEFDQRSVGVAFTFVYVTVFSLFAASYPFEDTSK